MVAAVPYAEVIGAPIAHSRSPLIHKFWLQRLGIEADFRRRLVWPDELPDYFSGRLRDDGWLGCSVTMPLKESAVAHVHEIEPLAVAVGALNLVYRSGASLIGTNTDVAGISEVLAPAWSGDRGPLTVCIIGGGGAARAMLAACRERGVERILFNVRDRSAALQLLKEWGFDGRVGPIDDPDNLTGAQVIVNATPLGMCGMPSMPARVLRGIAETRNSEKVVFDMVYDPVETQLIAAGRRQGLRTLSGLELLVAQARHAFRVLFSADPSRADDLELKEQLTQ